MKAAGTPSKATAQIRAAAALHGEAAIERLAALAGLVPGRPAAESDAAQVAAIKKLLDRGYGKPRQAVDLGAEADATPTKIIFSWSEPGGD